jgi:dextranase
MYRHDKLLPPSIEFIDPLGRELSLRVVEKRIKTAHQNNMAAMPYTAIYAASPNFAIQHPKWGLYNEEHTLYDFAEGFLKIMNPASDWRQHFINECLSVLDALPFDGIHVDQYGEPQSGFAHDATPVDLPQSLAETLCELHSALPDDKTLLFNLVHNWPLQIIARSPVNFLYCEIWPPKTALRDLMHITQQNWLASGRKTPVVAVYIDPVHQFTAKMVECVILASGGYHLVHGEDGLYLSDPYFPKAVYPDAELRHYLQQIADLAVAYQELLSHAHPIEIEYQIAEPIWLIPRQTNTQLVLNLLNVSPDEQWNQAIAPMAIQEDIPVQLTVDRAVKQVWCVSADEIAPPMILDFSVTNDQMKFSVPRIETWTMICIELESKTLV